MAYKKFISFRLRCGIQYHRTDTSNSSLLTLRDWYAHSLWSIFLCSYWWFCNWNSNASNVRIVIVGTIISTPVIIPCTAYRLKKQTKQENISNYLDCPSTEIFFFNKNRYSSYKKIGCNNFRNFHFLLQYKLLYP